VLFCLQVIINVQIEYDNDCTTIPAVPSLFANKTTRNKQTEEPTDTVENNSSTFLLGSQIKKKNKKQDRGTDRQTHEQKESFFSISYKNKEKKKA
jgi:hypothetical protein